MCVCVCVCVFLKNLTGPEFVIYRNSHDFCFNETFFLGAKEEREGGEKGRVGTAEI